MDGWNTPFLLVPGLFSGANCQFQGGYNSTYSPKKFNSSPRKNDAWKMSLLFKRLPMFRGELLNSRGASRK